MSGKIQWITYGNVEILFNDRSSLKPEEIIENVKQTVDLVKKCGKKNILYLVDNSNNIILPHVKDYIKEAGKELDPYLKRTAIVGASQAQKILINILSRITKMSIKVFDDLESAKVWLVS